MKQAATSTESDTELQLKVWKELAIDKQVLMRITTDALGLKPEAKGEDIKAALEDTVRKARYADEAIKKAQDEASAEVATMRSKVAASERAQSLAEEAMKSAQEQVVSAEQRIEASRQGSVDKFKKLQQQLAEKQKELKAINSALADTPENVVKKLKSLKKDKLDESKLRKQAENQVRDLKKTNQKLEQELEKANTTLEQAGKIIEQVRELHKIAESQQVELKQAEVAEDKLAEIPSLDEELLEAFQKAVSTAESDDKKKKK